MIIYAINIHVGGGKVLLDEILRSPPDTITYLFCDNRYTVPENIDSRKVIKVHPTIWKRLMAEYKLKKLAKSNTTTLMFGNLPPVFKLNSKVILYVQNILILPSIDLKIFSFRKRLKLLTERLWLKYFKKNVNEVWVQTKYVEKLCLDLFTKDKIIINPIVPLDIQGAPLSRSTNTFEYDYIYVASSDPHKNIDMLISVWSDLSKDRLPPKLLLVLSDSAENLHAQTRNLNIDIKSKLSRQEIFSCYEKARCLIYPSLLESYGLPILEAKKMGLKIMAINLPYAKEFNFIDTYFDDAAELKQLLLQ